MTDDDVLAKLTASSPRHLLEDLASLGTTLAKHDRARPEVDVFLASGQTLRARVISVTDHRDGAIALVHSAGSPKTPAVTFIRVDQIAAITVVDASILVRAPTANVPIPSKLELSRQAQTRADGLTSTLGRAVAIQLGGITELDDDGRRAVGVALPLVVEVIGAIANDDMGKEALAKIESIELGATSTGEVALDGRRLVIRAPKLLSEQYTHATLRKAIEKLL